MGAACEGFTFHSSEPRPGTAVWAYFKGSGSSPVASVDWHTYYRPNSPTPGRTEVWFGPLHGAPPPLVSRVNNRSCTNSAGGVLWLRVWVSLAGAECVFSAGWSCRVSLAGFESVSLFRVTAGELQTDGQEGYGTGCMVAGGDVAVVLFNRNNVTERITAWWEHVGLPAGRPMAALELWTRLPLGTHSHSIQASVAPHGCVMLRLSCGRSSSSPYRAVDRAPPPGRYHALATPLRGGADMR